MVTRVKDIGTKGVDPITTEAIADSDDGPDLIRAISENESL